MRSLSLGVIVVILALNMSDGASKGEIFCNKVLRKPNFDAQHVLDKTWQVYFVWGTLNVSMCLYIEFKKVTYEMVNEIRSKTEHMLALQPDWAGDGLLMYLGRRFNEYILFANMVPGKFIGYPTLLHIHELDRPKKKTRLIRLHMKLLYHKQYLLISHCETGITVLASYKDPPPTPLEIQRFVAPMKYGDIYGSCL